MWIPGRGHFLAQGHNLNKLGRGLLVDATYQISSDYAFRFQIRRFLKFSSWKSIFSLFDLDMQQTKPIWTIIKEGYMRSITAKFGQNQASSLGGDVLWSSCWGHTMDDPMTHNGRRTSAEHETMAQVS